ncbi:MAG: SIR2 family protein [Candidatus Omnitrophota bacterium]|jgi:hypothetical protein
MKKVVYFLGAGATKAVCSTAPLNRDLVKNALIYFQGEPEVKEIREFMKEIFKIEENYEVNNQIWNLLDYIIQQGRSISHKYTFERVSNMRNSLLSLVIRYFEQVLREVDTGVSVKFISAIEKYQPTIISTNYDIIVDNALAMRKSLNYGAKIRYAVRADDVVKEDLNKVCGFNRPWRAVQYENLNTGLVQLLKIHGSLNWIYCRKCDEVDLTMWQKGCQKTLTGIHCHNECCTNKYEPLLITPTMFKNYENRFIKETWNNAEKALIEADELVFIGYSLKEEDYQIRCLLMNALLNKPKNYDQVIVVEKEPENENDSKYLINIHREYKNLYRNVEFREIGFYNYVQSISG